jgi:AcrR family transcriptional regulator
MTITKSDRRVNRTRRQLRAALMALILEKGYDAVTIEDITERADLGRTTFYLHYRDKEELLLESIDTIAEELKAQISQLMEQQPVGDPPFINPDPSNRPIALVFRHAAENADLYHIILHGEGATKTSSRLRDVISEAAREFFIKRFPGSLLDIDAKMPVEVLTNYFAGSLLAIITWWLESGKPYTAEQMTEMFMKLFFLGGLNVLGLGQPKNDLPQHVLPDTGG